MKKEHFSEPFNEVMEYHEAEALTPTQRDRYFQVCCELEMEVWQWEIICKELMGDENLYKNQLPKPSRVAFHYHKLGDGKQQGQAVEKVACVKCGGHGTISIKAQMINMHDQIASVCCWSCPCENGDRFRQSKVPFLNFFDRFGRAVSKHKLLVEGGQLKYQDGELVVIKTKFRHSLYFVRRS